MSIRSKAVDIIDAYVREAFEKIDADSVARDIFKNRSQLLENVATDKAEALERASQCVIGQYMERVAAYDPTRYASILILSTLTGLASHIERSIARQITERSVILKTFDALELLLREERLKDTPRAYN